MNNIKLLLLDIDGLFYMSCKDTLEKSIQVFNEKLQNCLDKTECTHWIGFMGKSRQTFRTKISETYKSNRGTSPLKYLSVLKEWAAVEYKLNLCVDFEADDAVSYFYRKPIYYGKNKFSVITDEQNIGEFSFTTDPVTQIDPILVKKVIASPDKDILNSIAGKHFNYSYKLEDKDNPDSVIKGWWIKTNNVETYKFKIKQLLMGDNADGVQSIPGVGVKTAEKYIEQWGNETDSSFEPKVLQKYIDYYGESKGIYEFQKNYRLLHILESDSDFLRELGYIPALPEIQTIVKQNNEF